MSDIAKNLLLGTGGLQPATLSHINTITNFSVTGASYSISQQPTLLKLGDLLLLTVYSAGTATHATPANYTLLTTNLDSVSRFRLSIFYRIYTGGSTTAVSFSSGNSPRGLSMSLFRNCSINYTNTNIVNSNTLSSASYNTESNTGMGILMYHIGYLTDNSVEIASYPSLTMPVPDGGTAVSGLGFNLFIFLTPLLYNNYQVPSEVVQLNTSTDSIVSTIFLSGPV